MILEGFVLLLSLFVATPHFYVQPELKPYYNQYMKMVKATCRPGQYNKPLKRRIVMSDIESDPNAKLREIGVCNLARGMYLIQIDKAHWATLDEPRRFQLMAHEMTHCVLGFDHQEDRPNDYMYPEFNWLDPEEVKKQIQLDIDAKCVLKDKSERE